MPALSALPTEFAPTPHTVVLDRSWCGSVDDRTAAGPVVVVTNARWSVDPDSGDRVLLGDRNAGGSWSVYAFLVRDVVPMVEAVEDRATGTRRGWVVPVDPWESPLAVWLDEIMNEHDVFVWGWSVDGRRALVVNVETGTVTVAASDARSLGRWECSYEHLRAHVDVYAGRFPNR